MVLALLFNRLLSQHVPSAEQHSCSTFVVSSGASRLGLNDVPALALPVRYGRRTNETLYARRRPAISREEGRRKGEERSANLERPPSCGVFAEAFAGGRFNKERGSPRYSVAPTVEWLRETLDSPRKFGADAVAAEECTSPHSSRVVAPHAYLAPLLMNATRALRTVLSEEQLACARNLGPNHHSNCFQNPLRAPAFFAPTFSCRFGGILLSLRHSGALPAYFLRPKKVELPQQDTVGAALEMLSRCRGVHRKFLLSSLSQPLPGSTKLHRLKSQARPAISFSPVLLPPRPLLETAPNTNPRTLSCPTSLDRRFLPSLRKPPRQIETDRSSTRELSRLDQRLNLLEPVRLPHRLPIRHREIQLELLHLLVLHAEVAK